MNDTPTEQMQVLKVLIVEDTPEDVENLKRMLRRIPAHSFAVSRVAYGQEGLRAARLSPPDLVFLDLNLPDMTGLEFLDCLKQQGLNLAVLVLTGSSTESAAVAALKAGALDYLNKNRLDAEGLGHTIQNALTRHQLQQELLSTQRQLSTMIQEAPVGMALLSPGLRVLHVNETMAGLAGLRAEQLQGMHCAEIDSSLWQQLEWMCQRVLYSGKHFKDLELSSREGDQPQHWLTSVYPVRQGDGSVQFVGITVTDITRSKRTALLLQQSQERLNMTLEATRVGTWEWDSVNRKINWMGRTDRILGFHGVTHEPTSEDFMRRIHPDDQALVRRKLHEAVRNSDDFEMELRVLKEDGTVRWLMTRGKVENTESATYVAGALVDISDLKEAEMALREISDVQQRFVNDAAHELRAPLTAIQGNLDLIHRYQNMPDEDRQEALADVAKEATRLSRLVQDMLALARGDAGGVMRLEPLQLDEVVLEAVQVSAVLTQHHQVQLRSLPEVHLEADHDRIKQVLVILLENAAKYTPEGGTIDLELKTTGSEAVLEVSDSGMGIAPEDLERVFERFYRGQLSREKDPGGTGLGLPIARWIVEAHGGTIQLHSHQGEGTRVRLTLPLERQESTS